VGGDAHSLKIIEDSGTCYVRGDERIRWSLKSEKIEHNIWDKGDRPIINCLPMTEHLFISSSYVLHFE
jgi:hypothetical protein